MNIYAIISGVCVVIISTTVCSKEIDDLWKSIIVIMASIVMVITLCACDVLGRQTIENITNENTQLKQACLNAGVATITAEVIILPEKFQLIQGEKH